MTSVVKGDNKEGDQVGKLVKRIKSIKDKEENKKLRNIKIKLK